MIWNMVGLKLTIIIIIINKESIFIAIFIESISIAKLFTRNPTYLIPSWYHIYVGLSYLISLLTK